MAVQSFEITKRIQAPPAAFLTELAFGMKMTQALYGVAKLGSADDELLANAALRLDRIIPTETPLSILEVVKA